MNVAAYRCHCSNLGDLSVAAPGLSLVASDTRERSTEHELTAARICSACKVPDQTGTSFLEQLKSLVCDSSYSL